jgi:hypothetical protein
MIRMHFCHPIVTFFPMADLLDNSPVSQALRAEALLLCRSPRHA